MCPAAKRVTIPVLPRIGCLNALLATIGGKFRILYTGSHLHGEVVLRVLLDDPVLQKYIEVVAAFPDDPVHKPVQCKVKRRIWRHYEGDELAQYAQLVPDLAKARGIPLCYASTNTRAAEKFVARLRYPPNTVICCCYHAWIPRWLRQLCGERSGFGGRCFNIHPNDERCDMHRMAGTAPFEEVLDGPDRGMRMSLLRLVGSTWDDPNYVLQSTRLLEWPAGIKNLERSLRFRVAYQHTAVLAKELLEKYLAYELFKQLCAQNQVRIRGHVPTCPAPLYPERQTPVSSPPETHLSNLQHG